MKKRMKDGCLRSSAMVRDKISFSSDDGKISRKDMDTTSKMTEDYFGMEKDPEQIPATSENRDWVYKNIPDYVNIIRNGDEIIGYAFLLPCNRELMDKFISRKISEAELFERIKKIKLDKIPETIYLCASIVREKFRGRGLATEAFVKALNKLTHNGMEKPFLFYWKYSNEGERVAHKIADKTGLELRRRE